MSRNPSAGSWKVICLIRERGKGGWLLWERNLLRERTAVLVEPVTEFSR